MANTIFRYLYEMDGIRYNQVFAYTFSVSGLLYAVEIAFPALVLFCIPNKFCKMVAKILLAVSLLLVGLVPSIFFGLKVISGISAWFYTFWIFALPCAMILRNDIMSQKYKTEENAKFRSLLRSLRVSLLNKTLSQTKFYAIIFVVLGFPIFIPYILNNMCVSFFNPMAGGISIAKDTTTSTEFFRNMFMEKACPIGPPCQIYATLPEDATTGVILNFHTHSSIDSLILDYDEKSLFEKNSYLDKTASVGQTSKIKLEALGERNVHHVLLTNLEPDTDYVFELHYEGKVQYKGQYRTLPGFDSKKPLKIVIGGDAGSTPTAKKMTSVIANEKPDLIIIGGDAAYDNAIQACWPCWDSFFKMFDEVNQEAGRLIPLIFTIGNHDVGYNAKSGMKPHPDHYPLYFQYIVQHTEKRGLPYAKTRRSYFSHIIQDMIFISLDSMYLYNYDEYQEDWLRQLSEEYKEYKKFAVYHVPLNPARLRYNDHSKECILKGQTTWSKIFEEYQFAGVFENHNHNMKRTKPLTQGTVDYENGVRYFGDGGWGVPIVSINSKNTNNPELFEDIENSNHVWVLENTQGLVKIYPIDVNGEIIAESTLIGSESNFERDIVDT